MPVAEALKPFVAGSRNLLDDPRISNGAKTLHMHLAKHARRECFPGQDRLAADLGCSVRTINRYLGQLKAAGWIEVERRGLLKTNLYKFTKPETTHRTPVSDQDRTPMSDQDRTPMSDQDRTPVSDHCESSHVSGLTRLSSSKIAAAASAAPEKEESENRQMPTTVQTAERLVREGELSPVTAGEWAARDGGLCVAVLEYCDWLRARKRWRRIESVPAFVIGLLRDPVRKGFERTPDGPWMVPREARPRAASVVSEDERRRQAIESRAVMAQASTAAASRQRFEEDRYKRLKAAWDVLTDLQRAAIESRVKKRSTLQLFERDEFGLLRACLRVIELEGTHG